MVMNLLGGRKLFFVFLISIFFCLLLSFPAVSASITLGNATHLLEKNYAPGSFLKGWINISLDKELTTSVISAFASNITIQSLLNKSNIDCRFSTQCWCYPIDCSARFIPFGNGMSSQLYSLNVLQTKIVGVKLVGNVSEILDFKFNVNTNAGPSCIYPLVIDLLGDNSFEWKANQVINMSCYIARPYGCFNVSASSDSVTIDTTTLCQQINLPSAKGYEIGAFVNGTGSATLQLSLEIGSAQKSCNVVVNSNGEKSCTVIFDEVIPAGSGTVCVSSLQPTTNYRINFEDVAPCGFISGTQFNHDFALFAKPLMYGPVNSVNFNQQFFGDQLNLSTVIMNYISEKYNGACSPECIIPFSFNSGVNQDITVSSVQLRYKSDGLERTPVTNFYALNITNALLSSSFIQLSLDKASLAIPHGSGTKNYILRIGDRQLFENLTVKGGPTVGDIFPTSAGLLVPTDFTILMGNATNLTGYIFVWNFGDGSPIRVTTTNKISYTYTKTGTYSFIVNVSGSSGETTKNVNVVVGTPYTQINTTLYNYKNYLKKIEDSIGVLPVWVQEKTAKQLAIETMRESVMRLEARYKETLQSEEDKLAALMNELVALNVPRTFIASMSIQPIDFIQSNEIVDALVLSEFGAGTAGDEDYAPAINAWLDENIRIMIDADSYSFVYPSEEKVLFSRVQLSIEPTENIDELYLILDGEPRGIFFREDYGERELEHGYGIRFNELTTGTKRTVEFIYPGVIDISRLPFYFSPAFSELAFGIEPGVCNSNAMCEADRGENSKNCRADCKSWTSTIILFSILFFIAFVVYILLQEWYKRYYEAYLFKDKNQLFNVIAFMNNAENQKMSKDEIFRKLKPYRWNGEQLHYAWNKLKGTRTGMWEIPLFKIFENRKVAEELAKRRGGLLQ
ncbi:MAG: PKD domain-containing protein [Nanoarchaeota archaeon]